MKQEADTAVRDLAASFPNLKFRHLAAVERAIGDRAVAGDGFIRAVDLGADHEIRNWNVDLLADALAFLKATAAIETEGAGFDLRVRLSRR